MKNKYNNAENTYLINGIQNIIKFHLKSNNADNPETNMEIDFDYIIKQIDNIIKNRITASNGSFRDAVYKLLTSEFDNMLMENV